MESVGKLVKKFTYANTTSFEIGKLPPNSLITGITVVVTTAFNSSGTDLLDIGTSATADAIVSDQTLAAKGSIVASIATTGNDALSTSDSVVLKGIYAQSVADASAGVAYIVVSYVQL